ncbi:MAG: hypothetical protein B6229_05710 [Spirochaetaceae bacterium 4572_7]|nr:MAG: hypothetical protein B6229_05710 [Spirochaetaceae bacterium 4572_7]
MYLKEAYIEDLNNKNIKKLPKFHVVECRTILDQKNSGSFDKRYFWSNSPTVTLIDRTSRRVYKDQTLELCKNCKKIIKEQVHTTKDFHEILDINDRDINNKKDIKVDIYGRPFNWNKISRAYREEQNYICEDCGFGGADLASNYDKRYIHVHHIKSHELLNTHRSNLKALCILCHYRQDDIHISNFEKPKLKIPLKTFINKYRTRLLEIGHNPKDLIIDKKL